jgi:hypothetical protein
VLSLKLEPGERLQRQLEAAGKALAGLVEESINKGHLRIRAYPHPGAVLAASLAFSHMQRIGVNASLGFSVRPPSKIEVPTLLFGYPALTYRSSDVASRLIHIVQAERQRGHPPPGSVYLGVDGSLSTAYLMISEEAGLGGYTPELRAAGLAGIYLDGRVAPSGRLSGLDRVYIEKLASGGQPTPRIVTTIKVYRPQTVGLCEAANVTVVPPLGLAEGGPDACAERLAAAGLRGAAARPAASLDSNEIAALVDLLMDIDGDEIDASIFVSGLLVLEGTPLDDPREAAHALLYGAEALGGYEALASALLDPSIELSALLSKLETEAPRIRSALRQARIARARGPGWLRLYTLEPRIESPSLAFLGLQALGGIPGDSVVALVGDNGELLISPLQASMAEYELPRRLVESRAASEGEFWLVIHQE